MNVLVMVVRVVSDVVMGSECFGDGDGIVVVRDNVW